MRGNLIEVQSSSDFVLQRFLIVNKTYSIIHTLCVDAKVTLSVCLSVFASRLNY